MRALFRPREFAGGRVQVFGCSPDCLIVSVIVSIVATIILNLLLSVVF